jgi:hypothetical protein
VESIIADLEPGDRLDVAAMSFMDVAVKVAVLNAGALTPGPLLIATGTQEKGPKIPRPQRPPRPDRRTPRLTKPPAGQPWE